MSRQKFTIMVRLRPQLKQDYKSYKPHQIATSLSATDMKITIQRKNNEQKTFTFNHVLDPGHQQDVYEKSQHLVDSIFQGYNSTFLAYGQTGTGKTHTVFGSDGNLSQSGYFYNSVKDIFAKIKQKMHIRQFAVRVSFVEFYLDNIFDLLSNDNRKLDLKENTDNGVYIKDVTEIPVKSEDELFTCVRQAIRMRKTQQTSINKRSSRSHAVIQITLLQRWIQSNQTRYIKAMLKIVDLAGSERVSKTQSNGNRLQQAKRINKQITTLGKCINMLAMSQKQGKSINNNYDITNKFNYNKSYIPFRDAKITRFLSDSLDGKAKITLCVCVSKYLIHIEETFSSLLFASQASTLKIDSKRNQVYTMNVTPDKGKFQTPTKGYKAQLKRTITPGKSSTTTATISQLQMMNKSLLFRDQQIDKKQHQNSLLKQQQLKQHLLQKFRTELLDIDYFLQTRELRDSQSISLHVMRENLTRMNRIFNLYRGFETGEGKGSQ